MKDVNLKKHTFQTCKMNFKSLLLTQLFFSPVFSLLTSWILLVRWQRCEIGINAGANGMFLLFIVFPLLSFAYFILSLLTHLIIWKFFRKVTKHRLLISLVFYVLAIILVNILDFYLTVSTQYPTTCGL